MPWQSAVIDMMEYTFLRVSSSLITQEPLFYIYRIIVDDKLFAMALTGSH